jgi:hypothetical protein
MEVDMRPTSNEFERDPFQFTARADWEDGKLQTEVVFDVPKDKRLVIENISADIECPIGQEIISTQVKTIVNNVEAWHAVFVPKTATFENKLGTYSGGQRVRVYADPGTEVAVLVHKNSSQCLPPCGTTLVYISGYLLAAKSPSLAP